MTPRAPSKIAFWIGWILSGLVGLLLISSGINLLRQSPMVLPTLRHLGYSDSAMLAIGIAELLSIVLFLIPQTAVLGAVMLAAYLGGAVASHLRVGDPVYAPIIVGLVVWIALLLREGRMLAMFPWRN